MKINVFPASAGMILAGCISRQNYNSVPRECGDDPTGSVIEFVFAQCSPRVRG